MFTIPAGTELSVCRADDPRRSWRRHVTKRELTFDSYQTYESGAYTFKHAGWLIILRETKVKG